MPLDLDLLQRGVRTSLVHSAAVLAAVADRVWDEVPPVRAGVIDPQPRYPRINFGPFQVSDVSAWPVEAYEVTVQLQVWSDQPGYEEANGIAGHVIAALSDRAGPQITGHRIVFWKHDSLRVTRDQDVGLTLATLEFRTRLQPLP